MQQQHTQQQQFHQMQTQQQQDQQKPPPELLKLFPGMTCKVRTKGQWEEWVLQLRTKERNELIRRSVDLNFVNAGFETCFGWDPRHQWCWEQKYVSNPDVVPF